VAKTNPAKPKPQGKTDDKLTSDEDFKEAFPKQAGKLEEPKDPPPEPRSTDPRRKQR
jgi:hypothetical protein